MRKKDPIFWTATGIFITSLVLAGVFQNQFWLALGIGAYLLRPTLASLGLAKRYVDERQMSINYRSGNIAFVVMLVACVIFMVKLGAEDNHDFELFASVIIIGLTTKALFNVLLVRSYREMAPKIIIAVGLLAALFTSLEKSSFIGHVMESAPGLLFAGLGLLAKKFPKPVGVIVIILTLGAMYVILGRITWGQIVTAAVIGIPLLVAGFSLLLADRPVGVEPDRAR